MDEVDAVFLGFLIFIVFIFGLLFLMSIKNNERTEEFRLYCHSLNGRVVQLYRDDLCFDKNKNTLIISRQEFFQSHITFRNLPNGK